MPEQQYKREIEEILRLADESEQPDFTNVSYEEESSVFQYYFMKLKNILTNLEIKELMELQKPRMLS